MKGKTAIALLMAGLFILPITMGLLVNAMHWPGEPNELQPPYHYPKNIGDIIAAECHWQKKIGQNRWDHALIYVGELGDDDCVEADPHMEYGFPQYLWKGKVEYTSINKTRDDYRWGHAQAEVDTSQSIRDHAVEFAKDRADQERKFDFSSSGNSKQIDGPTWLPAGKYYCTEIVWAGYADGGKDLDPGLYNPVWVEELIYHSDVDIYWQWGGPD
ncbi:MAG: hypothetical protein U9O96_06660 [Candidatus Thermoplasmatota archaeon]|nr:hypothetical protein [Candidatus Thermoplasmatota archaeon]